MCTHNSMTKKVEELAARYGRKPDVIEAAREIIEEKYNVSAFTWPYFPIVTQEEFELSHWGLVPSWIRSEKDASEIKLKTINARADTLFRKPSFRQAARSRRCLIPSTGFFEWRHEDKKKVPYFIYLEDEPVFSIAGVYDIWTNPQTGEKVNSFSMVTTDANPMMEYIHNSKKRMPAILSKADEARWLNPALTPQEAQALLTPFDESLMEAYPVNSNFLRKSPGDPSIIERVSEER